MPGCSKIAATFLLPSAEPGCLMWLVVAEPPQDKPKLERAGRHGGAAAAERQMMNYLTRPGFS